MVKQAGTGQSVSDLQDRIDQLRSVGFALGYLDRSDMGTVAHVPAFRIHTEYYGGSRICTVTCEPYADAEPFVDFGDVAADDDGWEQCDTVRRSNFRVLLELDESYQVNECRPLFFKIGYGRTTTLGAFVADLPGEVIDMMISLKERYPVLDDDDLSDLESEEIYASWDAYLRSDLYLAMDRLRGRTGSLRLIWDHLGEEAVERLFWDAVQDDRFGGMIPTHDGRDVVWGGQDNMVKIFREVLIRAYWDRRKGCSLCGSDSDECMQGCRHQGEAVNG